MKRWEMKRWVAPVLVPQRFRIPWNAGKGSIGRALPPHQCDMQRIQSAIR
jgi:hypothetical protein